MDCATLVSLRNLRRGQHACLLYDEDEEPFGNIAAFVAAGLDTGERCILLGCERSSSMAASLGAVGVDIDAQLDCGALAIDETIATAVVDGRFDALLVHGSIRDAVAAALADGYSGLRLVIDMCWASRADAAELVRFEKLLNQLHAHEPIATICMYDRSRFAASACEEAMRTHPWVAVGDTSYANLYYEPIDSDLEESAAAVRVDWMIAQMKRVRHAEEQRLELVRARTARAEAEAAAKARDDLLSVLGHELRTPLTSMLAYAQAMLRRVHRGETLEAEAVQRTLEVVVRQATKENRLLGQVLDAARVASGHLPLAPTRCDLAALVHEVAEVSQAGMTGHQINVSTPEQATTLADPLRIEQVLVNLLDNAAKYSPPASPIDLAVRCDAGRVVLTVRDYGPGIPKQEYERIFDRYHRVHTDRNGIGLGLYISREIVRMHGGDLAVEAPSGGGTRFSVALPVLAAEQDDECSKTSRSA